MERNAQEEDMISVPSKEWVMMDTIVSAALIFQAAVPLGQQKDQTHMTISLHRVGEKCGYTEDISTLVFIPENLAFRSWLESEGILYFPNPDQPWKVRQVCFDYRKPLRNLYNLYGARAREEGRTRDVETSGQPQNLNTSAASLPSLAENGDEIDIVVYEDGDDSDLTYFGAYRSEAFYRYEFSAALANHCLTLFAGDVSTGVRRVMAYLYRTHPEAVLAGLAEKGVFPFGV